MQDIHRDARLLPHGNRFRRAAGTCRRLSIPDRQCPQRRLAGPRHRRGPGREQPSAELQRRLTLLRSVVFHHIHRISRRKHVIEPSHPIRAGIGDACSNESIAEKRQHDMSLDAGLSRAFKK